MPYPGLLDPEPLSQLQATADPYLLRRHSNSSGSVSQGLWVLVHTRFIWTLWALLVGKGFDSKCDFTPPTILLGLLLCSWTWGIFFFFFGGIQCSPVNDCLAESCSFGVLAGEDECKSLYSAIFQVVLLKVQKTKIMASSPICCCCCC